MSIIIQKKKSALSFDRAEKHNQNGSPSIPNAKSISATGQSSWCNEECKDSFHEL